MKKFLLICLMLISIVCLGSCTALDIPEGDIKKFISTFNGEEAFNNVHYGKSLITTTKYEGNLDKEIGKTVSVAYFDKRNDEYYHYLDTKVEGTFYGEEANEYDFNDQITMCYSKKDDPTTIISQQLTDGEFKNLEYEYDDVIKSVESVFYSEVTAGFHIGGIYYGDYVLKNISKYYEKFSLNDEKTELTFEINISDPTDDGNRIVNSHRFVVNSYGLINNIKTISYYIISEKVDSTLVTEMNCDYKTEFEKILDLKRE